MNLRKDEDKEDGTDDVWRSDTEACQQQKPRPSEVGNDEQLRGEKRTLRRGDGVREGQNSFLISAGSRWSPAGVLYGESTAAWRQRNSRLGPLLPGNRS